MPYIYVDNDCKVLLNTDKIRDFHISAVPPKTYKVIASYIPSGSVTCATYSTLELAKEHLERIRGRICQNEPTPSPSENQKS